MKNVGIIYDPAVLDGSMGMILFNNQMISYEYCEIQYKTVRKNDEVKFHIAKISSGERVALNIEFIKNPLFKRVNYLFRNQVQFEVEIFSISDIKYEVKYDDFIFLLQVSEIDYKLSLRDKITVFINRFSDGGDIYVSPIKNYYFEIKKIYNHLIKDQLPVKVKVCGIYNDGISVKHEENFGFIQKSHLINEEDIKYTIDTVLEVVVIDCSTKNGLLFSHRNLFHKIELSLLEEAFNSNLPLNGKIKHFQSYYIVVDFNKFPLYLNKKHLVESNVHIGDVISFKVIDFDTKENISISSIENTEFSLLNKFKEDNYFRCRLNKVSDVGIYVEINEKYNNAYLPFTEASNFLPWNYEYDRLKIGTLLNVSILKFTYHGLVVSRNYYKTKLFRNKQSRILNLYQHVELKIYDKFLYSGLLVRNDYFKGFILTENFIPLILFEKIDKKLFIKYLNSIYKKRSKINCYVSNIEKETNKVSFNLDTKCSSNVFKLNQVLKYFEFNYTLYDEYKKFLVNLEIQ